MAFNSGWLAGVRVLLVDDDADTLEMFGTVLTRAGATVTSATSAQQALTLVEGVDVVVTDYRMPGKTGGWLLEQILEMPTPVPVIMLTGFAEVHAEYSGLTAFTAVLFKPVDPWRLCEEIRTVIGRR